MLRLFTAATFALLAALSVHAQAPTLDFAVEGVSFDADAQSVTYRTVVAGQPRAITYALAGDGRVRVSVTDGQGARRLALRATASRAEGVAGDSAFTAAADHAAYLDQIADSRTAWLFEQHLVTHPSLGVDAFLGTFADDEETDADTEALGYTGIIRDIWAGIQIWDWWWGGGGGSDCLNPNQTEQCTETNVDGSETTVTFTCDCGTPICEQIFMTVEVPVVIQTEDGLESGSELRQYSKCSCYCLVMEFPLDN